jgi:hypothetical protein
MLRKREGSGWNAHRPPMRILFFPGAVIPGGLLASFRDSMKTLRLPDRAGPDAETAQRCGAAIIGVSRHSSGARAASTTARCASSQPREKDTRRYVHCGAQARIDPYSSLAGAWCNSFRAKRRRCRLRLSRNYSRRAGQARASDWWAVASRVMREPRLCEDRTVFWRAKAHRRFGLPGPPCRRMNNPGQR